MDNTTILKKILKRQFHKKLTIFLWKRYITFQIFLNCLINFSKKYPKLFYAGARQGDKGGPMVKIQKLNNFFPEHRFNFNIIYLLSNSIYLNNSAINLIKKKSLPVILNQNGVFYPAWFEGDWQKQNLRMSKIYHLADYVLWQSYFCKRTSEKFLGKRMGKGEVLYNAVDTSFFVPTKDSNNSRFTFLVTGNIRKKSNYRITSLLYALKETLRENKNICLKIAGYIEDEKYLFSKINELNLSEHINFLKNFTQKDAPKIYQQADAYITMSYQDNCPTAVIEAMACGLPILYSKSGGTPELVDKNSGVGLKVSGNWKKNKVPGKYEISNGMKEIIENKINMSEASRIRATEFFDIKKWILRHNSIFEESLEKI